jgi:2-polyprenyl-6-hydroxyphenyl methylase/3-demethylubiquinone-9 3-methyltransferase
MSFKLIGDPRLTSVRLALARDHDEEVKKGARFEFGKNWSRFLATLNEHRIALAERSLREYLETDCLDGRTFLDIGSGSGLFSLVARRLGAKVHSFDYDPHSVACTRELRRRFFGGDANWTVEHGSVLGEDYLASLGTFDIVYSWGVLHHTGQMWQALENVKSRVALDGRLFIAIYNDLGRVTDDWARVKRMYCSLPKPLAFAYAFRIIAREEWKDLSYHLKNKSAPRWVHRWRHYDEISTRGMSQWHDWIDWIGGYPYERATVEQIVDFYACDGFRLTKLGDLSDGYGCNQFVFRRDAPAGIYIDNPIPGGTSMVRRFGRRVLGPFERDGNGDWTGVVGNPPDVPPGTSLYLFRDAHLVGPTSLLRDRVVVAASAEESASVEEAKLHLVPARLWTLDPPFPHHRGHIWAAGTPDLVDIADNEDAPKRSPAFLFEDGHQLPRPHASHDDIDRDGAGRFSHWSTCVYFSSSDNTDPNTNGRKYVLLVPAEAVLR